MSTGERIDVEKRKDFVGFEELWGVFVSHMWDFFIFLFLDWDAEGGKR